MLSQHNMLHRNAGLDGIKEAAKTRPPAQPA